MFVRKVKIVVLDEATSSLDPAVDRQIQNCLHEAFAECTVLMIAHRIENIMGLDAVLYMDGAKVW